jgi:hypothetical protein
MLCDESEGSPQAVCEREGILTRYCSVLCVLDLHSIDAFEEESIDSRRSQARQFTHFRRYQDTQDVRFRNHTLRRREWNHQVHTESVLQSARSLTRLPAIHVNRYMEYWSDALRNLHLKVSLRWNL